MNDDCHGYFGRIAILTEDGELLVTCGLVGSGGGTVYYYGKQRMGDDYVLQQSIGFEKGVVSLAVDGNSMVVTEFQGLDSPCVIRFFVRRNITWVEVTRIDGPTLDERVWSEVALFGNQTLIASGKNVYPMQDYFNP